jgi:hypothetical protein
MGFLDDLKKAATDAQQAVQRGVDNLQKPAAPPEPPPVDGVAPQPPSMSSAPPDATPTPVMPPAPPDSLAASVAAASAPPDVTAPVAETLSAPPGTGIPAPLAPGLSTIPTAVPVTGPQVADTSSSSLMPHAVDPFSPPPAAGA